MEIKYRKAASGAVLYKLIDRSHLIRVHIIDSGLIRSMTVTSTNDWWKIEDVMDDQNGFFNCTKAEFDNAYIKAMAYLRLSENTDEDEHIPEVNFEEIKTTFLGTPGMSPEEREFFKD